MPQHTQHGRVWYYHKSISSTLASSILLFTAMNTFNLTCIALLAATMSAPASAKLMNYHRIKNHCHACLKRDACHAQMRKLVDAMSFPPTPPYSSTIPPVPVPVPVTPAPAPVPMTFEPMPSGIPPPTDSPNNQSTAPTDFPTPEPTPMPGNPTKKPTRKPASDRSYDKCKPYDDVCHCIENQNTIY